MWIALSNMSPQEYCEQVFLVSPAYVTHLLESAESFRFEPQNAETAYDLVDRLMAYMPSQGHGE
jgi:hypothetical protein